MTKTLRKKKFGEKKIYLVNQHQKYYKLCSNNFSVQSLIAVNFTKRAASIHLLNTTASSPPLAPTPLPKMCTNLLRCKKMDARRVFGNIDRGKIKVVVEKVVKTKFVVFLVQINVV